MPDRPDHRSNETRGAERIAQARAARVPVDHNGKPTGLPREYTYDHAGLLVSVTDAPKPTP